MKICRIFSRLIGFLKVLVVGAVVVGAPALAHHSEANRYMQGQPVVWQGTIQRVSWDGAHVMYLVSVNESDGTSRAWQVLGGSPQRLGKRGIYQHTLKKGTAVTVAGYLNVGSRIVTPVYVAPADGPKLFVGYVDTDIAFKAPATR